MVALLAQSAQGQEARGPQQLEGLVAELQVFAATYGLRIVGAIAILVLGWLVAKLLRAIVLRLTKKAGTEPTLANFAAQFTYALVITFVIIAAIGNLGVQTASFIAVIGAAGLAVGLALQGALANFAAGVLLMVFRPCRVDDFIEGAGVTGTVEGIHIFTTQLRTPDNKTVIVPNSKLMGDNITNYTVKGTRRVDLVIGVSYDADLKVARRVIEETLGKDERILDDPAPTVAVGELADSSVNFVVRPWTSSADYWDVYFATLENVKVGLDEAGVVIPFPQQDVHLHQASG